MATTNPILSNPFYLGPPGINKADPNYASWATQAINQYQAKQQQLPAYRATTAPAEPAASGQVATPAFDAAYPDKAGTYTTPQGPVTVSDGGGGQGWNTLPQASVGPFHEYTPPAVAPAVEQSMPSENSPNAGYGAFREPSQAGQSGRSRGGGSSFTASGGTLPRANDGGMGQFRDMVSQNRANGGFGARTG